MASVLLRASLPLRRAAILGARSGSARSLARVRGKPPPAAPPPPAVAEERSPPAPKPDPWTEVKHDSGQTYWWNTETNETTALGAPKPQLTPEQQQQQQQHQVQQQQQQQSGGGGLMGVMAEGEFQQLLRPPLTRSRV